MRPPRARRTVPAPAAFALHLLEDASSAVGPRIVVPADRLEFLHRCSRSRGSGDFWRHRRCNEIAATRGTSTRAGVSMLTRAWRPYARGVRARHGESVGVGAADTSCSGSLIAESRSVPAPL